MRHGTIGSSATETPMFAFLKALGTAADRASILPMSVCRQRLRSCAIVPWIGQNMEGGSGVPIDAASR
jgi:hypothetical protein